MIHETAIIDEGAVIGAYTRIWHWTHVMGNAQIGSDCIIGQSCFIAGIVGDNCKIQNNVSVYNGVIVKNAVFLGPSCVLTNMKKPRALVEQKDYQRTYILDGATIGANATILPGVTIGKGAMIGAGAVVTMDVPDGETWVGNPARRMGIDKPEDEGRYKDAVGLVDRLKKQREHTCGECSTVNCVHRSSVNPDAPCVLLLRFTPKKPSEDKCDNCGKTRADGVAMFYSTGIGEMRCSDCCTVAKPSAPCVSVAKDHLVQMFDMADLPDGAQTYIRNLELHRNSLAETLRKVEKPDPPALHVEDEIPEVSVPEMDQWRCGTCDSLVDDTMTCPKCGQKNEPEHCCENFRYYVEQGGIEKHVGRWTGPSYTDPTGPLSWFFLVYCPFCGKELE